jgi:hypothetical protein
MILDESLDNVLFKNRSLIKAFSLFSNSNEGDLNEEIVHYL